ncbi:MAG: RND transporter [Polaromonas sp.]|uniref:TolC family protein n=1 Tax=Polaromonas sp. TaxID=1869339 RepID=UPI0032677987
MTSAAKHRHVVTCLRLGSLALLVLALTGCTTAVPDGGVSGLQALATTQPAGSGTAPPMLIARPGKDASAAVAGLLKGPLSAENAVRIALLNNPGLQLSLAGEGVNITDSVSASPAKLRAAQDIAQLTHETRKAWINAVAAAQTERFMDEARESAETAGELARRMARAGNWSKLQQAREQLLLAGATTQLARARQAAFSEREKLVVVMGLWGTQADFILPDRLPDLPAKAEDMPDVESRVLQQRLDLRLATAQWAGQRAIRPQPGADGLWDAMGDSARVRELAVRARSEAREAYHGYRSAYDLARHYQTEVMPLYRFIQDETVLRYNGMLTSIFELLAGARAQALAAADAIEAQRDFWLAEADLQTVLAGASPGPRTSASSGKTGAAAAH